MEELNLLEGFNDAQRAAIEYCDGPSLVVAGAGSGKTRVLTYKVAYLMSHLGLAPWSILALTFTNKAASEMKERIARQSGAECARYIWMGTFHSIFLRILRTEHEAIGFPSNFTIYDEGDSRSLMKSIIKDLDLDDKLYKPSSILGRISNAKNQLVDSKEYRANASNYQTDLRERVPETGTLFAAYENQCRLSNAMDFDDILLYTYRLLANNEDIRNKYAERFKFVLVDEYQDTNFAQHQIVWQLTKDSRRVCVVGDDAQSIYSFRGANIDNILTFNQLYPEAKLFRLERNYRSTKMIVDAANSLISKNSRQIKKTIYSENEEGDKLQLIESYSDKEEGEAVVRRLRQLKKDDKCEYRDFAILYRTNAQSRIFEEVLRKNNMPYKIYGGLSFYQRKEIKDVIAYFRLAVNPDDGEALKRVINYPARGIGATTLAKINAAANAGNASIWQVVEHPADYGMQLSSATAKKLIAFSEMIERFSTAAAEKNAYEAGTLIINESGILKEIYKSSDPEDVNRQENLSELISGIKEFVDQRLEEDTQGISVSDYLSEVSLISDLDSDDGETDDKVTLMTVHSAKGLEFNNVFVVGMEENLFPNQRVGESMRELEEERRLFYVAITRARKRCILSYAKSRFRFGKMEFENASRFISDIGPQYINVARQEKRSQFGSDEPDLPWKRRSMWGGADNYRQSTSSYSDNRSETSWRSRYDNREERREPRPTPTAPVSRLTGKRLTPVSRVTSTPTNTPLPLSTGLSIGARIRHERFGLGVVENIEGSGDSTKATVSFEGAGRKQLLLKFARFSVVED